MQRIFKYPLDVTDVQHILMSSIVEFLHIDVQHGEPCLWALVDDEAKTALLRFDTFGTGHEIAAVSGLERHHIGTYQMENGALVWHVFHCAELGGE